MKQWKIEPYGGIADKKKFYPNVFKLLALYGT